MKIFRKISIVTIALILALTTVSAGEVSPKREFRGVWFTTVWGIDWPKTSGNTTAKETSQKASMDKYLDQFEELGLNAIFFQVRGMCDAFYKSHYEPWSPTLVGSFGLEPTYDPLAYIIEEAHKRGMEVHAWYNPYRYATSSSNYNTLDDSYDKQHHNWICDCGGTYILNPGIPEVRQRVVEVVMDVVNHYDVDGIVFDDYFYQDGFKNEYDNDLYEANNPKGLSRGDWRRDQVNQMVIDVNNAIKAKKPWCRFGIGPAGVAASDKSVADKYGITPCPSGSDWQYNSIYSEPIQWYVDHSLDYIAPQIYWPIGTTSGDYAKIAPWWASVANQFGRHMYVSQSLSSLGGTKVKTSAPNIYFAPAATQTYDAYEIVTEIDLNRASAKEGAPGMVYFSAQRFSAANFIKVVAQESNTRPAIVPSLTWFVPEEMQGLVDGMTLSGQTLSWTYDKTNVRFGIYAIPKAERHDTEALTTSKYYLGLSYSTNYTLASDINANDYAICVTVIDRYGNEYSPRFLGEAKSADITPVLTSPHDAAKTLLPAWLEWQPVTDAMGYMVEIARDANFTDVIALQPCETNKFLTQPYQQIDGSDTYYWRVMACAPNAKSNWSAVRSFGGKMFSVTSPTDGAIDVSTVPTITWDNAGADITYTLDISTANDFLARHMVYSTVTTDTFLVMPQDVLKYTTNYFIRVTAENEYMKVTSFYNSFVTENVTMTPPTIISPTEGENVVGPSVVVMVATQPNNGFKFQLCQNTKFAARQSKIHSEDVGVYSSEFTDLEEGQWYARAATKDVESYTEFSEVVSFTYTYATGVTNVQVLTDEPYIIYTIDGRFVASGMTYAGADGLPLLQAGTYIVKIGNKTTKIYY